MAGSPAQVLPTDEPQPGIAVSSTALPTLPDHLVRGEAAQEAEEHEEEHAHVDGEETAGSPAQVLPTDEPQPGIAVSSTALPTLPDHLVRGEDAQEAEEHEE